MKFYYFEQILGNEFDKFTLSLSDGYKEEMNPNFLYMRIVCFSNNDKDENNLRLFLK